MDLKDKNRCKACGSSECKGNCPKQPKGDHEKGKHRKNDDFPNRIWPTDQEKNKGPKF